MRKTLEQQIASFTNKRLLNVDFHDFLQKSAYLEDVELGTEFSLTSREVQEMKARLRR
ncbi:hypothetical protein OS242_10135 [Tumebacillus sp. DT12]|uniref:Uncharacterized protein n=1 Tax=Tumebacillus lacus TaxID=2995335 RepID=A0ABT3X3C9_9BACL|nr:hypothetical protein [Tumebacillus lacus]MCX7570322.1 hypothetical protein [Tumebacillus lacus]